MSSIKLKLDMDKMGLGEESLREIVEFNLFDSQLKHVARLGGTASSQFKDLLPGAYKVTAQMPDGQEHEKLIVLGDKEKTADFTFDFAKPLDKLGDPLDEVLDAIPPTMRRGLERLERASHDHDTGADEAESAIELVSHEGANCTEQQDNRWTFEAEVNRMVPVAVFKTEHQMIHVSLPTSPADTGPMPCSVHLRPIRHAKRYDVHLYDVHLDVSKERPIFKSMLTMMAAGRIDRAAGLTKQARSLLHDKFIDPTAAAYGALILFQLGMLDERPLADWAKKLFRYFGWINDVEILRVAANTSQSEYLNEDFQRLLECSKKPVLFTSAYSMLITQLRQWAGELSKDDVTNRSKVLKRLASHNTHIDWSAPTVVFQLPHKKKE